jgi:hypothetical protein
MTAAVATAAPAAPAVEVYRDDGPIAEGLGALGARLPVPPLLLMVAGSLPLLAAIVLEGDRASEGLVGAVIAAAVLLAGLSSRRPHRDRLAWTVPVLLRATEYAGLLWLGVLAGGAGVASVFALLCAIAFRQYDIVYRLRHRGVPPPAWTRVVSGGWDGRLVVGYLAWIAGVLPAVFFVAGAALAVVLVGESALGWAREAREGRRPLDEDDDAEGDV